MIRRAFTFDLKPDTVAEYKEKHDNIWPELVEEMKQSGIAQMTVFEAEASIFIYSEIVDEAAWNRLWATEIHDRWGQLFADSFARDESGEVVVTDLTEIFHLEPSAR